jgi:hypothetical protein
MGSPVSIDSSLLNNKNRLCLSYFCKEEKIAREANIEVIIPIINSKGKVTFLLSFFNKYGLLKIANKNAKKIMAEILTETSSFSFINHGIIIKHNNNKIFLCSGLLSILK